MNPPIKVLVAEDEAVGRSILEHMLRADGFEPILATDGLEAVERYAEHQPDLVLMDALMPRMDGWEAARLIKASAGERFVPIIFLTGVDDDQLLVRCLESGGDDFLNKPWRRPILKAKINAQLRVGALYDRVMNQRDVSRRDRERLLQEQAVAERIAARAVDAGCLGEDFIQHTTRAAAIFNGDRVLAARDPGRRIQVLLGDAAGHGIAAAHSAMPATDLFNRMTAQGFDIRDIAQAINQRLKELLPPGLFFAAVLVSLDPASGRAVIINAGMPDVLILGARTGLIQRVRSSHLPLGIVGPESFGLRAEKLHVKAGDRIYLCSDGVTEARDSNDRQFGQPRLEAALTEAHRSKASGFDAATEALEAFRGARQATDDTSLLELTVERTPGPAAPRRSAGYHLNVVLKADSLKRRDPIPALVDEAVAFLERPDHRARLLVVVGELFNNALEHGLLSLDGQLKDSPEGFTTFYAERANRLAALDEGWIRIEMLLFHEPGAGRAVIRLAESGPGFEPEAAPQTRARYGGQGLDLVRSLCERVEWSAREARVEAIYLCTAQEVAEAV